MTNWLVAAAIFAMPFGMAPMAVSHGAAGLRASSTDGRALYTTHCASCHGVSGRGDGPVADSLRRRPSDLTQFARTNGGVFPSARMHRIVDGRGVGAHGSVEMPVWGDAFTREAGGDAAAVTRRIDAIVRYLESIQERAGY